MASATRKAAIAWVKKNEQQRKQWAGKVVDPWATTLEFSRPLNWGEAEQQVLSRKYPPLPGRRVVGSFQVFAYVFVGVLFFIPLGGSALTGTVLVVIAIMVRGGDHDGALALLTGAMWAFGVAAVVALLNLIAWSEERRRTTFGLVTALLVGIPALVGAVLLWLVLGARGVSWLTIDVGVATSVSALTLVLMLVSPPKKSAAEKASSKRRSPPRRGPRSSSQRERYLVARGRLLEILVQRNVVRLVKGDMARLKEMPLGYWSELDGVDDKEWRRILEYRLIGWREFTASDRRGAKIASAREDLPSVVKEL